MRRAACTIVSPNYLAFARTLSASYLAHHPDHLFFVLLVADIDDAAPFRTEAYRPVLLKDIGLADMRGEAMKYDILELNTNVKPTFMKHLLAVYDLQSLVYLDPDIYCYAPLEPVFAALDAGASAVLTPHITTPVFDGRSPSEQDLLYNGTYNLGFIAVGNSAESLRLLTWWEERCLALGFSEGRTGLFVDQKWMNLAPGLFDRVAILRDAGCNMAYWNLHERTLFQVHDGYLVTSPVSGRVPLRFFHFSGVVPGDAVNLSKHTNRFTLADRPDLLSLFASYKATVLGNRWQRLEEVPYGFDTLSDGTAITRVARRLYAAHYEHFRGSDPFAGDGAFAAWARKEKLVAGKAAASKAGWSDFNPKDKRVEAVHSMLRFALRVLGPGRYELLMRYLAHISVLRNQGVFLRDAKWDKRAGTASEARRK